MARRRVRVVRVRLAAWAVAAAACLGLPLSLAVLREGDEPAGPSYVVRDAVSAAGPGPGPGREPVELEPPSADTVERIAELRAAGDVDGLLAVAARAREDLARRQDLDPPAGTGQREQGPTPRTASRQAATRRAILAVASLCRVPGPRAEEALRTIVTSDAAPALERTTALAALWERGERELVEEQGRDSEEPAIRSKVRALRRARP